MVLPHPIKRNNHSERSKRAPFGQLGLSHDLYRFLEITGIEEIFNKLVDVLYDFTWLSKGDLFSTTEDPNGVGACVIAGCRIQ